MAIGIAYGNQLFLLLWNSIGNYNYGDEGNLMVKIIPNLLSYTV